MNDQKPAGEAQNSRKNWYATWWGIILILMFLPFFAIWYIWAKTNWNAVVKGLATLGVFLVTIMALGSGAENSVQETSEQVEQKPVVAETRSEAPAEQAKPQEKENEEPANQQPTISNAEEQKTEEQESPVEPFEIAVTSQIVKKVSGKHRYFFDIRNNDKKDFSGKVSITLYNDKQSTALGNDTFTATSPIEPKMGDSVYFEINTGPTSVHGEYGITKFKYEVKVDEKVVKSGEGKITDKYEDLSQYGL